MRPRFSGKSRPQRFSICGRLCDGLTQPFVLLNDGVYRLDDGGLEARFFERMDALDGCAAGRGDFIDQRHRMLAGFLAELCCAERRLAGNFLRQRARKPGFTPADESASIYICTNAPEAPPSAENAANCASGIS